MHQYKDPYKPIGITELHWWVLITNQLDSFKIGVQIFAMGKSVVFFFWVQGWEELTGVKSRW